MPVQWRLKRCPKCRGDQFTEENERGILILKCFQCGKETNLDGSPIKSPFKIETKKNWLLPVKDFQE